MQYSDSIIGVQFGYIIMLMKTFLSNAFIQTRSKDFNLKTEEVHVKTLRF